MTDNSETLNYATDSQSNISNKDDTTDTTSHETEENISEAVNTSCDNNEKLNITIETQPNTINKDDNRNTICPEIKENISEGVNTSCDNNEKLNITIETKPNTTNRDDTRDTICPEIKENISEAINSSCDNPMVQTKCENAQISNNTQDTPDFDNVVKLKLEQSDPYEVGDNLNQDNDMILGSITPEVLVDSVAKENKKRKFMKELKELGITDIKDDDNEFFIYTDGSDRIYRKYRLREGRKPDYRIPTTIDIPNPTTKKPQKEIHCTLCEKTFTTKNDRRLHIRKTHTVIFTCSLCLETFTSNKDLIDHKQTHNDEDRSYICHKCKVAFSSQRDYLLHEITHSKPNDIHTCIECGLGYEKHHYSKHILTHFDLPEACPICSKEVKGEEHLRKHIREHDVKRECVECGKVMSDKRSYEDHMLIHTGVKKHQCLYCGKGFRLASQKNVHTRIHTNERPYKCEQCPRTFKQYSDWRRHIVGSHTKEKKYKCDICMKMFLHSMELIAHKRIHTPSSQYNCPECEKGFTCMTSLRSHVVYHHTTEMPYHCTYCDMKFKQKKNLRRHYLSKVHKNNVYRVKVNVDVEK